MEKTILKQGIHLPTLKKMFEENCSDEVIVDYIQQNFTPSQEIGGKKVDSIKEMYTTFLDRMNELFGRRFRYTNNMAAKLKTRLKTFTFEEIMQALENLAKDPFYQGNNDRGWKCEPDFLLRNDSQIDRFLNHETKVKKDFEMPNKQLAVEIILYACLKTGAWEEGVRDIYKNELIPWMMQKNICPEFPRTGDLLIKFLNNRSVSTGSIANMHNHQQYDAYIQTCKNRGIEPKKEIVDLGKILDI